MTELVTFEVDKVRFVQLKDAYARGLKNFNMEQPTSHAIYHNDVLLSSAAWTKEELIEELDELTPEAVQVRCAHSPQVPAIRSERVSLLLFFVFSQAFIPLLLSNVYIEALFHGNLTQARALELMDIVESKLADTNGGKRAPSKRMRKSQRLVLREVQLTPDSSCVFLSETKVHKSSCIEIYFQCGPRSTKTDLYLKMLSQILSEPAFDQLRTKEQLGYVVWCGMRRKASVQGLRVLIMSDKHPSYLDERIELFLETMEKNMEELSEEAYEKHRSAVKANILEKPKKLSSRTSKYWTEIANGYYHFNRDQIEAQELDSVSKEDVLAFFKQHISAGSKERRKMSCHVISKTEDGAGTVDDRPIPQGALEIKDSNEFKECRGLHPKLLPFVPTSSLRNKNYTSER